MITPHSLEGHDHVRARSHFARLLASFSALASSLLAQPSSPSDVRFSPWVGSLRCEIRAEAPGYLHQETQLWTLTGTAPAGRQESQADAVWSVTGQGRMRRGDATQSTVAEWSIERQELESVLGLQVLGNDSVRIHLQPPVPLARGALTGSTRISDRDVPQPATRIVRDVAGWQFDPIQRRRAQDGSVAGHLTREVIAAVGPTQPNDAKVTVTVAWSFAMRGTTPPPLPPATLMPPPSPAGPVSLPPVGSGNASPLGTSGSIDPALESRIAELERRIAELERALANRHAPPTSAGVSLAAIESVTPASSAPGTNGLRVTITGRGTAFAAGATTADFGPGIAVTTLTVDSPTSATATLAIDRSAADGARTITMTTGSEVASLPNGFSLVLPGAPPLTSSPASPAASGPSGSYRIVLNGFSVRHRTYEGNEGDGPGDEVYAAACVQVTKRDLSAWTTTFVRTAVHGNTQGGSNRIRGGSADGSGGFIGGDVYPIGNDPVRPALPAGPNSFPFLIWEGTLSDGGDVVVVKPVLWEADGDDCAYRQWWQRNTALAYENDYGLADAFSPVGNAAWQRNLQARLVGLIAEGSLTPVWGLTKAFNCYNYYRNILPGYCECQPGKDRPIGVQWNGTDPGGGEFRGATLLITREAIEKALNAPPTASGLPPGVVSVRCLDQGPLFDGDYEMFIKVERVGGPPATPPSGTAPTPGTAPAPTVDVAPPAPMQRTVAPEPAASSTPSPSGPDRPTRTSEGTVVRLPERSGFPSLPSASPAPPASGSTGTVPPGSTATPAPVSGTYLVSVTAVWCSRMTRDDPFDRDGKGDEIYAAAFVRRYDRTTFQLVETTNLRTLGYGDTNGRSDRALGGTMTRTGGVGPGNVLPPGGTPARTQPAQASVLPMRVWQGTLTDGADALVISPTIWEDDDTPTFFAQWVQGQQQLSSWIFTLEKVQTRITTRAFAPLVLESTERISYGADQKVANVTGGIIAAGFGIPWNFDQFFVQKMDRPIGVAQNDFNSLAVPNTVVVLTREVIEMALSASPPPVDTPAPGVIFHRTKPGVMVITFQDTATEAFRNVAPHTDYGHYVMTLQVERL